MAGGRRARKHGLRQHPVRHRAERNTMAEGFLSKRASATAEAFVIPLLALVVSLALFGVCVMFAGKNPFEVYGLMYEGAFGSWFSWQNSLTRAAPLILTALCTALPSRLGLIIIGNEGALVMGGLCAAATAMALPQAPPWIIQLAMAAAGIIAGGLWIALAGILRHVRAVNETISSLLLVYIATALLNQLVEGPLRDPASLNKPSTPPLADGVMIGTIPGTSVHWGLVFGVIACIASQILIRYTTIGFSARVAGGNVRAARMVGLPVGALIVLFCFLGGGAAGLAGMVEVAAVLGSANASLIAGYGYAGILVSFLARHNPIAIIP